MVCDLQVYPTHLRATGMGASGAMARIGGMITPLVAQVTTVYNFPRTADPDKLFLR